MRHALRAYQRQAVDATTAALMRRRRPILVAPTGSGKTVMATALVEELGRATLWLAHRQELIDQAAGRLRAHGLDCGIVMAERAPTPSAQVQVASVQTLVRRDKPPAELVVVDEAHHATANSYQSILDAYPDAGIVGLTATPFRLDGCGLGDLFNELVAAARTDELCNAGLLHAPRVYASEAPDMRGVKMIAGDYQLGEIADRAMKPELTGDIVRTWQRRAEGKRTVCFAINVAHSQSICEAFRSAGVAAEHIDGTTHRDERAAILARLASGETNIVSNCMVLTEGWDLPALECAILARPTASLNLHLQMIGRIMRAAPGKEGAIVLDHAGNTHVHGLVTRELKYSLDSGAQVGRDDALNIKRCQACGLFFALHLPACPECGWVPEAREEHEVRGSGELEEFAEDFHYRRKVWNLLEAERMAKRYKDGWTWYRYRERFDSEPVVATVDGLRELIDPPNATTAEKRAVFEEFSRVAIDKGFKQGWASHRYRALFGCWPTGFVSEARKALAVPQES